jgi:hypothetical protein
MNTLRMKDHNNKFLEEFADLFPLAIPALINIVICILMLTLQNL